MNLLTATETSQIDALVKNLTEHLRALDTARAVMESFQTAAESIGAAWSGSSLGYHSCVYFDQFQPPPPGSHFNAEWGLQQPAFSRGTTGAWSEHQSDAVTKQIQQLAGNTSLSDALDWARRGELILEQGQNTLRSISLSRVSRASDPYLQELSERIEQLHILSMDVCRNAQLPTRPLATRDTLAISQGLRLAPHQEVLAQLAHVKSTEETLRKLSNYASYFTNHIAMTDAAKQETSRMSGSKVFIGHGRSDEWRKLADFLQNRLSLEWDEFNRVSVAGLANTARLSAMLDDAGAGLIVMTAEDELVDGTRRARENVVHEAGLFQGRLGFDRAVVLLEEKCTEFSNISGLGQIRFPAGNIGAAFEQVRQFLEREGLK